MIKSLPIILLVLALQARGQSDHSVSDAHAKRIGRVGQLWSEIQVRTADQLKSVTKEYAEGHVKEIRATVTDDVLAILNRTDNERDIQMELSPLFEAMRPGPDSPTELFVHTADLRGLKTVVVGFNIQYGGRGFWDARATLQGYRKTGMTYQFAAENNEALVNCTLALDRLISPRPNEIWELLHGQLSKYMGDLEVIRLFSFDGYKFQILWEGGGLNSEIITTKDAVTVTYSVPMENKDLGFRTMRDTVALTSGGPVVSTSEVQRTLPK